MKRLVIIGSIIAMIVFMMAFPASAAEWEDLVYTTSVENGNVTYTLDLSPGGHFICYRVYPYEAWIVEPGEVVTFDCSDDDRFGISFKTSPISVDRLFLTSAVSSFYIDFNILSDFEPSIYAGIFEVLYYDSSYELLKQEFFDASLDADGLGYSVLFSPTVPSGCEYIQFLCTENFYPFSGGSYAFYLDTFAYSFTVPISSVENQEVLDKLEEQGQIMDDILGEQQQTNEKLDDAIYGDHGFDSSGSDFSGLSGSFADSAGQANNAMNAGMDSLGSMMNSADFNSTLTVLAAGVDAVFTGHEITICGVTGNPFTLLVSIAGIAVILMLAMKFIFRKWGSGGSDSSGGGSSDA